MIAGIGIDLCEVARIRRALEGPTGRRFRARVFTAAEAQYCDARGAARFESFAARFAAKEAAMKVFGTGWGEGVGWLDIEVGATAGRAPALRLYGEAARLASARRLTRWHLSLAHTRGSAIACVLAETAPRRTAGRPGRRRA